MCMVIQTRKKPNKDEEISLKKSHPIIKTLLCELLDLFFVCLKERIL